MGKIELYKITDEEHKEFDELIYLENALDAIAKKYGAAKEVWWDKLSKKYHFDRKVPGMHYDEVKHVIFRISGDPVEAKDLIKVKLN